MRMRFAAGEIVFGEFEHASLQVNFNMMPFDAAMGSMRLFAREVMPRFTEAASLRA